MKSNYVQIEITKNEVHKLFTVLGFISYEYEGGGTVCLNQQCISFNESNGSGTQDILTKDEYILSGFQCTDCGKIFFSTIEGREYDSKFDFPED